MNKSEAQKAGPVMNPEPNKTKCRQQRGTPLVAARRSQARCA